MNNKDFKLWISYVGHNILKEFNIKENNIIQPFEANNINYKLYNINNINNHYAEICLYYYIWKNQLKSDYISIGHHRRFINKIDFNKLDNNEIQYFDKYAHIDNDNPYLFMLKDGLNEYILFMLYRYLYEIKHINKDKVKEYLFNKQYNLFYFNIIACNWEVFNDICNFIFGFMEFIIPNHNYTNEENVNEFINDLQLSLYDVYKLYDNNKLYPNNRVLRNYKNIGCIFELLLSCYCNLNYNTFTIDDISKKIGIDYSQININDNIFLEKLQKWISKNTFTGCHHFYIKSNDEEFDKFKKKINELTYGLCGSYIHVVKLFDEDIIELNLNEYIDTETPFDKLTKNNIKTFIN